ncbi:MAG TPA: hypothetical protein VJN66_06115 [Rhodanobacteraceae bacterium]|nr:hypothetical protein [Rhodanobacteraceae bacterium]
MKKLCFAILVSTLGLAVVTTDALACGEVLFHSGQGMRYHAFITRHPANILVYSPGTIQPGSAQSQLYAGLERAGHHVLVVTDGNSLASDLAAKHYDVIIASARDMDAISRLDKQSSVEPAVVAVVGRDAASTERFPVSVQEGAGLNAYLKVIDRTTRSRGI